MGFLLDASGLPLRPGAMTAASLEFDLRFALEFENVVSAEEERLVWVEKHDEDTYPIHWTRQ